MIRTVRGSLTVTLIDQGISSATNFAAAFLIARAADTAGFGAFSLSFAVNVLVVAAIRSMTIEAMLTTSNDQSPEALGHLTGYATRTAFKIALGVAAIALTGAQVAFSSDLRTYFTIWALALPGLAVMEVLRYSAFVRSLPWRALVADLIWLSALMIVVAIPHIRTNELAIFAVWAGGATLGVGTLLIENEGRYQLRTARGSIDFRISAAYFSEAFMERSSSYGVIALLGMVSGLETAGALNGARTLFGPATVLFLGWYAYSVTIGRSDTAQLRTEMARSIGGVAVASMGFYLLYTSLPSIGSSLLGSTWNLSKGVLLPFAIFTFANGITMATVAIHRRLAVYRRSLVLRVGTTAIGLIIPLLSASIWGTEGAAWGFGAAAVLAAIAWTLSASRLLAKPV